jgi:serine protease Do
VQRGYIGVSLQSLSAGDVAETLGIDRNRGELITSVTPGGPAARAGVEQGDVVLSVAGQPVTPDQTLAYLVSRQPIGTRIPVELLRNGQRRTVNVQIAERPNDQELARLNGIDTGEEGGTGEDGKPTAAPAPRSLGMTLQTLTPELAQRGGIRGQVSGVVITELDPNSDAAQQGLRAGDIIVAANGRPTPNPQAVSQAVEAARGARRERVLLVFRRGNGPPNYIGVRIAGS